MEFFAHDNIRGPQKKLIDDIMRNFESRIPILAHAPTGLGKTAASLAAALEIAKREKLTVFFLTSRHTQHKIVMETLHKIKEKTGQKIIATSIVGKKWMCAQPGIENLPSSEMYEYCKTLKEGGKCEFYTKTRDNAGKLTVEAKVAVEEMIHDSPIDSEQVFEKSVDCNLCPYEAGISLASKAKVIVTDYYYVFHPRISEHFFNKIQKTLDRSIIIIDEGHNLPDRMRDLSSSSMSTTALQFGQKEASKYELDEAGKYCYEIEAILRSMSRSEEKLVTKNEFFDRVKKLGNILDIVETLACGAEIVREQQKRSALMGIALFLEAWQEDEEGFTRYIETKQTSKGPVITLKYLCLDPSVVCKPIIEQSYSTLLMSGTLTPTAMYADLLGMNGANQYEYESPFDVKNRLALVIPKTTTKYTQRSDAMFKEIAKICSEISNAVPGNSVIFFPSYAIRDQVFSHFSTMCEKTSFLEAPGMSKAEKTELMEKMIEYKRNGATLLCAASGSFGEGIDLPGDLLKGVIIVGLPLGRPDLPTQELIKYYDSKYNRGWDYGYVLPALTKTFQNAGRCIRTETDRGIVAFVDERYAWPRYFGAFPQDWELKIKARDYKDIISKFFDN